MFRRRRPSAARPEPRCRRPPGSATLRSADGTEFRVHYAHPAAASDRRVVILPDVPGLHRFYEELAQRFAEAGLHAIAIDYFERRPAPNHGPTTSRSASTWRSCSPSRSMPTWARPWPAARHRRRCRYRAHEQYRQECDDAWRRILEFVGRHAGAQS